jgi:hypothetical protein
MMQTGGPGVRRGDNETTGFVRGLGLFDSTMIVVGVMIGSADRLRSGGGTTALIAWEHIAG